MGKYTVGAQVPHCLFGGRSAGMQRKQVGELKLGGMVQSMRSRTVDRKTGDVAYTVYTSAM